MPFGKNKALAVQRPKKKKVAAREEAPESTDDTGISGVEVGGATASSCAC